LLALGTIAVMAGVLRLAGSALLADAKGRRDALYWVVAGALTAIVPF
jgi:hypothetical protein